MPTDAPYRGSRSRNPAQSKGSFTDGPGFPRRSQFPRP